jgi:CHAT domain-containing protein/tetratricopeptide (TPR) repeat protein
LLPKSDFRALRLSRPRGKLPCIFILYLWGIMAMRLVLRVIARVVLVAMILAGSIWAPLRAQSTDELDTLGEQVGNLTAAGKYPEAIEMARRSVALAEKTFGPDHMRTAYELYRLGNIMRQQSQFAVAAAAHPLLLRALAIFERNANGQDDLDVAHALSELGWTSILTLHLPEAQQFFSRSLAIKEKLLESDDVDVAYTLDGLAMTNMYLSQYEAAARFSARSLEIKRKRLEPTDKDIPATTAVLATIKFRNGQMAEAGKLYQELLEAEKAKSQPDVFAITDLTGMVAMVNFDKGDFETAERQAREVTEFLERNDGTARETYYNSQILLAGIFMYKKRYAEAESAAQTVIQAFGSSPVVQPRDVMNATNTLAIIYTQEDRYADAEQALKKVVAIAEQTFGETSVDVAKGLENLAYVYAEVGRSTEALDLFRRILRIRNEVLPAGHPDIGFIYANRSIILNRLQRFQEAEADAREALRILEANYGEKYPIALTTRDELGAALKGQGRYAEALQVYKDAIIVATAAEGESSRIPLYLHSMGLVLDLAGRYTEAEDAFLRSIAAKQAGTISEAQTREALANLYTKMSRYREARENFRLAMAVFVEAFKKTAASRREYEGGIWLKSTASAYLSALLNSSDYSPIQRQAVGKEAFEVAQWLLRTTASSTLSQLGARYGAGSDELAQSVRARQDGIQSWQTLNGQLDSIIAKPIGERDQTHVAAVQSELAKLETRLAELDQVLAKQFPAYVELSNPRPVTSDDVQKLLRTDEALVQFLLLDRRVVVWVVTPSSVFWYPLSLSVEDLSNSVEALRCGLDNQMSWTKSRCSDLLKVTYSDADRDVFGKPLPFDLARAHDLYKALFGQVEDLIKDKRLLIVPSGPLTQLPFQVLVQSLPDKISAGEHFREVARLGINMQSLSDEDREHLHWSGDAGIRIVDVVPNSAAQAAGLTSDDILLAIDDAPVSTSEKVQEAIGARTPGSEVRLTLWRDGQKHDYAVILGAMKLREWRPLFWDPLNGRTVRWLARDHAITVLPAVSSLKALRELAKESHASEPYIGFGDPLLDGEPAKYPDDARQAKLAREKRCEPTLRQRLVSLVSGGSLTTTRSKSGQADVADVRLWAPLPETADELCDVAHDLGVDPKTHLYLGAMATETNVKNLSASGTLARYRIVHFATHGALAGQVAREPGLVLTPPVAQSETDNGYLTASEITGLKLDADWVILSACNTAAGGAQGAEALSGLARAFFYAGARSLLVSHWAVASESTVKLITKAIAELKADPKIGRAEALRRSMLSMIDTGKEYEAHPAFWAPFVLVGEGGAAR